VRPSPSTATRAFGTAEDFLDGVYQYPGGARSVGLYYLVRSLAIAPAAFVGGLLWQLRPSLPFLVAGAIGLAGTSLFTLTLPARDAA
jgi:hypothetical protein